MEQGSCVVRLDPCHLMSAGRCKSLLMVCTGITVCCGLTILGLGVASTTFIETTFTSMTQVDIQHIRSSTTGIGIAMLFLAIWGFFATLAGRVIFLYLYVLFLLLFAAVEVIMTAIIGHALTKYRHLYQDSADCMNDLCRDTKSVTSILAPTAIIFSLCTCVHMLAAWAAYLLNFEFKLRKRESMVRRQTRQRDAEAEPVDHNNNYFRINPEVILHKGEATSHEKFLDPTQGQIRDQPDPSYFTQIVVPGKKSSFRSYAHHQSIGDISALHTYKDKHRLEVGDVYNKTRARSCDNLSSPRPEITVSFIGDSGSNTIHNSGSNKENFIKVNVEPYLAIHLPMKRSSQESYEESHARDLCHMDMGYYHGEPFKNYDDSVFPEPEVGDYHDINFTMPREPPLHGSKPMYSVEEDSTFRYERKTSADLSQGQQYLSQDLNTSLQGRSHKRKTPREVKRQNVTSKAGRPLYGSIGDQFDQEMSSQNQNYCRSEVVENFGSLAHVKDAATGKPKPSYLSLPGLHLGEKFYALKVREQNSKSRSMEILCDTENDKLDMMRRPHSVADSSFPMSLNRNDSGHTLMKSMFSGTYWKDNGPDHSISSVDLQNSLMASRSTIQRPVQNIPSPNQTKPNEMTLLTRSCGDLDNSETAESSFGRSMLRKSVIDPGVAQSFQRVFQRSQFPSPQTTPTLYKTPIAKSSRKQRTRSHSNSDDSSFISFHSAKQGDVSHKQSSEDSDSTQNTCSSIPYYNYDQELDHCLNQMMMLASELQKKEFGQSHNEAAIEVSPLVKSGKSRSCSALMNPLYRNKAHGASPTGSYDARPYSRESAGSRGSASSQCSAGFKAAQLHNNSRYSAESMII